MDRRGRDPVAAAAPLDGALRQLLRRSGGVGHLFEFFLEELDEDFLDILKGGFSISFLIW